MLWKFIMFYPIVGRVALAVSVLSVFGLASAFERDHDAHEHGPATLTVVQEGHDLHLSFNSPAMDIVGFEHAPSNDAERAKIANAKKTLEEIASFKGKAIAVKADISTLRGIKSLKSKTVKAFGQKVGAERVCCQFQARNR